MGLSIGDRVFYTKSTGLRVPPKVVGLLHDGHAELEPAKGFAPAEPATASAKDRPQDTQALWESSSSRKL